MTPSPREREGEHLSGLTLSKKRFRDRLQRRAGTIQVVDEQYSAILRTPGYDGVGIVEQLHPLLIIEDRLQLRRSLDLCDAIFMHRQSEEPTNALGEQWNRLKMPSRPRGRNRHNEIRLPSPRLYEIASSLAQDTNARFIRTVLQLKEQLSDLTSRGFELRMAEGVVAEILTPDSMRVKGEPFAPRPFQFQRVNGKHLVSPIRGYNVLTAENRPVRRDFPVCKYCI